MVAMETRLVSASSDRELLVFRILREEGKEGEGEGGSVGGKRKDGGMSDNQSMVSG